MDTKWTPSRHQVVTKWTPSGHQVDTKWTPSGHQVDTKWALSENLKMCPFDAAAAAAFGPIVAQ